MKASSIKKAAIKRKRGRKLGKLNGMWPYLGEEAIEVLLSHTIKSKHPLRDKLLMLIMFRYAMLPMEICDLSWKHFNFSTGVLRIQKYYITKANSGSKTYKPYRTSHRVRNLFHQLYTERDDNTEDEPIFRRTKGTRMKWREVGEAVLDAGENAGFSVIITPGHLRRACGYKLASLGVSKKEIMEYMGVRSKFGFLPYNEIFKEQEGHYSYWHD